MHTTKFAAAVLSAQKIPQYKFIPFQGTSPLSARWLRYIQCMLKFDRSTNEIWSINELPAPPLAPSFFVGQSTELSLNPRAIHSGHVFCGRTQLVHVVHDLAHGLPVILEIACSQRKKKNERWSFIPGKNVVSRCVVFCGSFLSIYIDQIIGMLCVGFAWNSGWHVDFGGFCSSLILWFLFFGTFFPEQNIPSILYNILCFRSAISSQIPKHPCHCWTGHVVHELSMAKSISNLHV